MTTRMKTEEIVYDEKIYPRESVDRRVVQRYQEAVEKLPPITVDRKKRIVDGYHRLMAYRAENIAEIEVNVLDTDDDAICLETAIRMNATHGHQLIPEDKKNWVRRLYTNGVPLSELSELFSISEKTALRYTVDIREEQNEDRDKKILDLYLKCYTEEEISAKVGLKKSRISEMVSGFGQTTETEQPPSSFQFTNYWDFDAYDPQFGEKYPGRMPGQVIENLLWYFTKPYDLILDPMAGSGTTGDVCKAMSRRYAMFDLKPDDLKGIEKWDITNGLPKLRVKQKPKLIVLDPPYSIQKQGEHTKQDTNLSNLTGEEFYNTINTIAKSCISTLAEHGKVACMIGQIGSTDTGDLAYDTAKIFLDCGFELIEDIFVPYENDPLINDNTLIEYARKNKLLICSYRHFMIFQVI